MQNANNVFELANKHNIIAYYHAAAGHPTKSTWLVTVSKGFFNTWLLLTEHAVNKHFLKLAEMVKGHMRQQQQRLRSMKQNSTNNHFAKEGLGGL